jgi:predicted porin
MKKTLIAAAAVFAVAGAMADVTVTGTIDATLRMSDDGDVATTKLGRDGSGTTGVIFRVNEDLGGGMKAIGLYEHDFNFEQDGQGANTGSNDGTGERFVGLQGAFGTIKLGVPNAPSLTLQSGLRGAPFGTKDGGRASAGGNTAGGLPATTFGGMFGKSLTRYNNSILYETPNFSGFSAIVDYVPATETSAGDTGAITDIGLFYRNGPIWAGVSLYSQGEVDRVSSASMNSTTGVITPGGVASTAAEEKLTTYAIHYNFGFATLGLGGHVYTRDGDDVNSGMNVLANVPLSEQLALGLNFQTLTDDTDTTGDLTQIAVGVNYRLSKTTSVYARYVTLDGDDFDDAVTTMLAGLRLDF